MLEQEKLKVLTNGFGMLEESGKDYIRELTSRLVDIHCSGEFSVKRKGKVPGLRNGMGEFNPA